MSNLFLPEATQASPGNAVWSLTLRPDWWVPLACSGGSRRCHNEKVSLSSVLPRRWWLQAFFIFTPLFGEDSHFDSYFSIGLKPSTRVVFRSFFQLPSTQFGFYRNFTEEHPKKDEKLLPQTGSRNLEGRCGSLNLEFDPSCHPSLFVVWWILSP